MPFFIIIPIWLFVLVLAGGLAFIPNTRRVAAYIAVSSTSGLMVSIALSTLALILAAKMPWSADSAAGGVVIIMSYVGGMVLGGFIGIAVGCWGLFRLTGRRSRKGLR